MLLSRRDWVRVSLCRLRSDLQANVAVAVARSHRDRDCGSVPPIHMQAPVKRGAGRTDPGFPLAKDECMKKRLLITGIVFAALLLALYGVVFGTGGD